MKPADPKQEERDLKIDENVDSEAPKAPKADKKDKEETITFNKEEYETMMATIKSLQEKVDYVADKDRLQRFSDQQNRGKQVLPTAGVSSINDKYILGWRTVKNEAEFRNNQYFENQIIEVMYEDGKKEEMELQKFYRHKVKNVGEIVEKKTVAGKETLVIRLPEGKEITIGAEFIN